MPEIVSATAVDTMVIATRPTKLQATLMAIAASTPIERVPTDSAMALAASVAPLTKMVPSTNTMTMARKGFAWSVSRNRSKLTMGLLSRGSNKVRSTPALRTVRQARATFES